VRSTKGIIAVGPDGAWRFLKLSAEEKAISQGYRIVKRNVAPPSLRTLEKYSENGIARAMDGCKVEPDGTCMHGAPSWLLKMGLI
jgi:hypothetical protein